MNYLKIFQEKLKSQIKSIDPGYAVTIFVATALIVFAVCLAGSPYLRGNYSEQKQSSEIPRGTTESHPKRVIPPQSKNGKRKRRFVKKEIKHMETEERVRRKEEKKEESKAERNKQKKADNGQQKQLQKTSFKKTGNGNPLENGGGRSSKQKQTTVRNVPRKRS